MRCLIFTALFVTALGSVEAIAVPNWSVGEVGGAPGLLRNGKPVAPVLFWQWRLEREDVKAMTEAGVSGFSCFGSYPHYDNPYWRKDGSCSPDYQTKSLDELLEWSPNATMLPRIFVTAPDWWIAEHPEESIRWSNANRRKLHRDSDSRESFASEVTRAAVAPHFAEVVRTLKARYGEKLMGIHITNGPWGENFSWESYIGAGWPPPPVEKSGFGDISAPMTKAFRVYLRAKYGSESALRTAWREEAASFENAAVPTMAERLRFNDECWRDPAEGRKVADYFECQNRVTVDMLEHYAKTVKGVDADLPVLVFYGYTQDENWTTECDHRAISRAYRSPNLNFFSAPHTYHRRKPGEDGSMRQYLASAALHGKLYFDEGDDMTYLERRKKNPDRRAHSKGLAESLDVLYRAFGMSLTHGVGMWFMDLAGGNFRDPELVKAVGRCRKWSEESLAYPRAHISEVAVISQPESEFYMGYRQTPDNTVSPRLYREEMAEFYRTGAPFDWYLAEDLEAVRARKYKVVALLDCEYLADDQYATLLKMKAEGVRFVCYHAPGYVSQRDLSWERVRALTGGDECRELVHKPALELRGIFEQVGVHLYTRSDDLVLSANASHIMLHARKAGSYAVKLPTKAKCIRELVSGRLLGEDSDACTVDLKAFETAIIRVER